MRQSTTWRQKAAIAREVIGVLVLCSSMLLTQSALSQTVITLPYVSETFGIATSPGEQSWLTAAYSLTVGTFVLPSGRLGDMYGHRRLCSIGFAWFAIFEMIAGLIGQYRSESRIAFDVVRGLIGIGPAILLPNSVAILARLYSPASRAKLFSFCIFAATAPNGFILGGVFSALFARNSSLGWQWGFYVFAIILAGLCALTFVVIPSDEETKQIVLAWQAKADDSENTPPVNVERAFDPIGSIIGVAGLILFNFAFNQAIVVGWQTVYVYVLLIIGAVLICAFIYVEGKVKDPLVPLEVFTLRTSLVLGCVALGWSSFGTFIFYSVRFLQDLRRLSPLVTVAQFVPCGVAGCIAAFSSVFLLKRIGPAWVMLGAMCAFCAANALIATMPIRQVYWIQMFIATAIAPFGMDMSFPSASLIISEALPPERQGTASSLVNTIINYFIAFGLGLAATVEVQVNRNGMDVERGFRGALYLGTGLAGLGIVCALSLLVLDFTADRRGEIRHEEEQQQQQHYVDGNASKQ